MSGGSRLQPGWPVVDSPARLRAGTWRRVAALAAGLLAGALLAADGASRVLLLDATLAGREVIAVGEHGTILRSADSGRSWSSGTAPTRATLTGVSFAPDGRHGWAVGHDALILSTADAGATWRRQWQGPSLEASLLDVCALDAQRVIAVGAYGLCMVTDNGGANWHPLKVLDEDMHLNRITRGPTGTLYLAGERGTLLRSRDRGATWQRIESPYDGSFYGVLPLGAQELLAYGLRGRVFRSVDDGDNWVPANVDEPMLLATALRTRDGAVILAGQARAWFGSRNGQPPFAALGVESVDATAELIEAPDGTVLAVGEAGVETVPLPWRKAAQ